jgi:hypothetical protein
VDIPVLFKVREEKRSMRWAVEVYKLWLLIGLLFQVQPQESPFQVQTPSTPPSRQPPKRAIFCHLFTGAESLVVIADEDSDHELRMGAA